MRLDQSVRKAKRREAGIRKQVEGFTKSAPTAVVEPRISYYRDAEECGHLAHVRDIVDERCQRCQGLIVRDGNGNLVA